MISIIIGYVMAVNLVGIILMWLKIKTNIIKMSKQKLNIIFFIISIIGGFIGVLVGSEMMGYERDNKLFRRIIPLVIFLEICIAVLIIYNNM